MRTSSVFLLLEEVVLSDVPRLKVKWPPRSQGGQAVLSALSFLQLRRDFHSNYKLNVPTELRSAKSWAAATKQAVKWVKKEKKRKTKISSLWRRVNKPSVGGGHWTQEPKFSFQSAESKTCHESRSPTDDKKTEITRTAWGMFHIILLFFFLLYFHHSNGKI